MLGIGLLLFAPAWLGRDKTPHGRRRAKATIIDVRGTPGSAAGFQLVEMTLEVRPKGGVPFQVTRKFSAGRLGAKTRAGNSVDVHYDPADPERIELA